jgi:uncharacterized membrane protein YphA (DoxX/SURF4 family)
MSIALWIIQVLLALMFLFAGGTKLVIPYEQLVAMGPPNQVHFSEWFIKFIGVCELLGALGLVLPGLLRIKPMLTPIAAIGLLIIMIGAVVVGIIQGGVAGGIPALIVGLLCAFVAYGRSRVVPHAGRN